MIIYMYMLNKIVIFGGINFDFIIIFNKQGINVVKQYNNCKIIYLFLILGFDFNCNLILILCL